jgi:hypothetical protein
MNKQPLEAPDADATGWNQIATRQQARTSAVVEPLKLGGVEKHPTSRSLDSTEALLRHPPAEPEADTEMVIDFAALPTCGLTRLEYRAIIHHFKYRVPVYQLHAVIGLATPHEAGRVLEAALAKVGRTPSSVGFQPVANSRRLSFRERLDVPGFRPWALNRVDDHFRAVMAAERRHLFSTCHERDTETKRKRSHFLPIENRNVMQTIGTLKKAVDDTARNHDRVCEHLHSTRVARDEAELKLSIALGSFQKEHALTIHENRAPDTASANKQLAILRTELHNRENDLLAAADARVLSEAAANEAKYQLESQRRAAAEAAIAKLRDEYLDGQLAQVARLVKILEVLNAHRMGMDLILPEPPDQYEMNRLVLTTLERSAWIARCAILTADYRLFVAREQWPDLKRLLA